MRTITTKVYTFDELNEKAQEKALDNMRYTNVDYDWWESLYEDAANIGLRITAFDLDRNRHAEGEFMVLGGAEQVAGLIMSEHGDVCKTYQLAKDFVADSEKLAAKYPKHEDEEHNDYHEHFEEYGLLSEEFLKNLLEEYSIMLQNEYEYRCGDEAVKETIRGNEYEFTEDGSPA